MKRLSGEREAAAEHVRDQRLSLMTKMYSALVFVISKTLRGVYICSWTRKQVSESCLVFWLSAAGQRSLLSLCCFPLWALGFGLGSFCLPGAFRRTASAAAAGSCYFCLRGVTLNLVVRSLQLVVLLAAQLSRRGPGAQRPLLVSLAEGVRAELAESLWVFPADVTVVPGAIPASCRERGPTADTHLLKTTQNKETQTLDRRRNKPLENNTFWCRVSPVDVFSKFCLSAFWVFIICCSFSIFCTHIW